VDERKSLAAAQGRGSVVGVNVPSTVDLRTSASLADGPLLRPDQAAHLLSVKTSWVYEAVRSGRVPCVRVGRHIRFTREMLEEWLAEQPRE
jgi:excisionase family DNA binding protein